MGEIDLESEWVHLKLGKEFSRILYPNPVCLLATVRPSPSPSPSTPSPAEANCLCADIVRTSDVAETGKSAERKPSNNSEEDVQVGENNVMVLSWLTPTNNHGKFMFSINKSRYSASLLAPSTTDSISERPKKTITEKENSDSANKQTSHVQAGVEFALSVPVRGMEKVILDVGSISGRLGSKFPSVKENYNNATKNASNGIVSMGKLSNRQRKKLKRQQLTVHGVEGLIPVPLGSSHPSNHCGLSPSSLFAIKGTVAHLKCRTSAIIGTTETPSGRVVDFEGQNACGVDSHSSIIDDDHLLVMAEVADAFVHRSYWDDKKALFRPVSRDVPPYLTFFGSQTFGYVTSGNTETAG